MMKALSSKFIAKKTTVASKKNHRLFFQRTQEFLEGRQMLKTQVNSRCCVLLGSAKAFSGVLV